MQMDRRVMNLTGIGDEEGKNVYITVAPYSIIAIVATDDIRHGRPVKKTAIVFGDGSQMEAYLSEYDLITLQNIVGAYEV